MNYRPLFESIIAIVAFATVSVGIVRAEEPSQVVARPASEIAGNEPESTIEKKPAESTEQDSKAAAPVPPQPINPAAELLGRLKPDQLESFAQLLDADWPDKPEWAEMAIAVMRGQAMNLGAGWWRPTEKKYGWAWLRRKYDKNSDNIIERDEFKDATPQTEVFFERLDRDLDGKVASADFDFSAREEGGPAVTKSRMSEFLFHRLDTDSNGQVTRDEILKFFERADEEKSSFLTTEDILTALDDGESRQTPVESREPPTTELLAMFLRGELGWFGEGPKLGGIAPDFTLTTHDNSQTITLSQSRDKKPVVVIFGSFT